MNDEEEKRKDYLAKLSPEARETFDHLNDEEQKNCIDKGLFLTDDVKTHKEITQEIKAIAAEISSKLGSPLGTSGHLIYTNELLEENNKVLKENEKNTRAIYYVLLVIGVMLAWIMFTVVFQIEPFWK